MKDLFGRSRRKLTRDEGRTSAERTAAAYGHTLGDWAEQGSLLVARCSKCSRPAVVRCDEGGAFITDTATYESCN